MTIYDAVVKCKGDYSLRNIMSIYAKEFSTAPLKVINTLSKNLYKFIRQEYSLSDLKRDLPINIEYANHTYNLYVVELNIDNRKSIIGGYKSDRGYLFYHIVEPPNMFEMYEKIKNSLKNFENI